MLFQRLRAETQDLHDQIEHHLPVFEPDFTRFDYVQLLSLYLSFYTPVEAGLELLRGHGLSLFADDRRKCPLLLRDLRYLGSCSAATSAKDEDIPPLNTVCQGIGCMYVLEGSTLGGQFISRHLRQKLGVTPDKGGAFFASYGENVGRRWNEFRASVGAERFTESEVDDIVRAARDTFRCFDCWLGRATTNVS